MAMNQMAGPFKEYWIGGKTAKEPNSGGFTVQQISQGEWGRKCQTVGGSLCRRSARVSGVESAKQCGVHCNYFYHNYHNDMEQSKRLWI